MSELRTDTMDPRLLSSLTPEERHAHYTALYNFWESVSVKHPTRKNIGLAARYKSLKESEE